MKITKDTIKQLIKEELADEQQLRAYKAKTDQARRGMADNHRRILRLRRKMEDASYVMKDGAYPYIYFGGKNKKQINDLVNEILLQSDVLYDIMLDLKNM